MGDPSKCGKCTGRDTPDRKPLIADGILHLIDKVGKLGNLKCKIREKSTIKHFRTGIRKRRKLL